jgi:anion-transporting  ArsA/GET3 family ATPase
VAWSHRVLTGEAILRERNSTRHKSLLRGIVYFENSPFATECVVRDLSGSGARLEFAALPLTVAEWLDLQIPARGDRHRWRSDMEIGIAFADALTACEVESIAERMKRLEAEIASLKQIVRTLQRQDRAASAV